MPKLTAQEKLEKKRQLEEKREARSLAKGQKEKAAASGSKAGTSNDAGSGDARKCEHVNSGVCYISKLSDDSMNHILWFTSAREMGALAMTCRQFSKFLVEGRVSFLVSRLHRPNDKIPGAVGCVNMCTKQSEARTIIEQSYGGGDTGRIRPKGKAGKEFVSEFVAYARFLEEAVSAYATQSYGGKTPTLLPPFVNGRFVSVSPEHSVTRVGGGGNSGAGGSGVATFGVGKRGQLGHGKRLDEKLPRMLLQGIGYGIRIVQVSAGGGLVRVAHTLLLTSSGRVLSFGTGQYGALGHGYSGGKQLPDILRPHYIEALAGTRIVCVSAGEIHSAAVSLDGDVYTWGDGFCGQLGHAEKKPEVLPVQVECGGLDDECVSHVSCGARHTLAVTEEGEVFSWGLGHFGVLGRSFTPYDHDSAVALAGLDGEDGGVGMVAAIDRALAPPPAANDGVSEQAVNDDQGGRDQGTTYDFGDLMAHLDRITNLSLVDSSDQCIPKMIDSLQGIKIIGASAGHRHTLLLDEHGSMYSCGAGDSGCLGHGDNVSSSHPMKIKSFGKSSRSPSCIAQHNYLTIESRSSDDDGVKVMQMSAGVDMSMAVSTTGDVFAWGKTEGGRLGLGMQNARVTLPRRVRLKSDTDGQPLKAVDVECGYVHSLIVGINGQVFQCGTVGIDGAADGQQENGEPTQLADFNIWHRIPEPREQKVKQERWKKFGKYEVQGRQKMMEESADSA
jgi:alpha-tubulin suppressor-like RCC1 family protein